MQEAMRQREAEWQAKAAAKRADDAGRWTKKPESNVTNEKAVLDSYVVKQDDAGRWTKKSGGKTKPLDDTSFEGPVTESAAGEDDDSASSANGGEKSTYHDHSGGNAPKGKFIVCDHCRSHGLPCDEDSICAQCIYHGVACVHHWCKLSKASKADCPRAECHYVHKDHMPTSDYLQGVDWLVVPGNLRGYMSAGRKGRMYGTFDERDESDDSSQNDNSEEYSSDDDSETYSDDESVTGSDDDARDLKEALKRMSKLLDRYNKTSVDSTSGTELEDIKRIQAEGLADMASCVSNGEASWDTVILTCGCIVQEQEEGEERLQERMARMAKNRRGDAFLVRYE
ncbi:hypothetical protein LTR56_015395 [Elasticomyces elasticus]|nr:hypothetical protein LTR22_023473 [Elasticomyces elasticus]KAK3634188.1 hypothetical protein LTR56_015395 [Elasticomyces elasticus]KAK4912723.1 hypothetical protein LTR49_018896 [Elasticomyces elasticus]KAK5761839.1 hypothetical protein LTS12_008094 [Elasticomyces elasticus]